MVKYNRLQLAYYKFWGIFLDELRIGEDAIGKTLNYSNNYIASLKIYSWGQKKHLFRYWVDAGTAKWLKAKRCGTVKKIQPQRWYTWHSGYYWCSAIMWRLEYGVDGSPPWFLIRNLFRMYGWFTRMMTPYTLPQAGEVWAKYLDDNGNKLVHEQSEMNSSTK